MCIRDRIIISGFLSGSETALTATSKPRILLKIKKGNKRANFVLKMIDNLDNTYVHPTEISFLSVYDDLNSIYSSNFIYSTTIQYSSSVLLVCTHGHRIEVERLGHNFLIFDRKRTDSIAREQIL